MMLHTFQVMKTVDKQKPIKYFRDNFLKYKDDIKKRENSFLTKFIDENPNYAWVHDGFQFYLQIQDKEAIRIQKFIWDQVEILFEICLCYVNENQT